MVAASDGHHRVCRPKSHKRRPLAVGTATADDGGGGRWWPPSWRLPRPRVAVPRGGPQRRPLAVGTAVVHDGGGGRWWPPLWRLPRPRAASWSPEAVLSRGHWPWVPRRQTTGVEARGGNHCGGCRGRELGPGPQRWSPAAATGRGHRGSARWGWRQVVAAIVAAAAAASWVPSGGPQRRPPEADTSGGGAGRGGEGRRCKVRAGVRMLRRRRGWLPRAASFRGDQPPKACVVPRQCSPKSAKNDAVPQAHAGTVRGMAK